MRVRNLDERIAFESHLADVLRAKNDALINPRFFRRCLAALRPHELVACWFRHDRPALPDRCVQLFIALVIQEIKEAERKKRPLSAIVSLAEDSLGSLPQSHADLTAAVGPLLNAWLNRARPLLVRRSDLFAWVYQSEAIAAELATAKLPSAERRRLIGLALCDVRHKMPWMTGRLVCAMAFRPSAFDAMPAAGEKDREPWGPLYRRVSIPKGNKTRYLHIPNPPLKALQKSILRILQPEADRFLSAHVFGARLGIRGPAFMNAEPHLNQHIIASFDIRDFFASTTVADVIRGLQFLAQQTRFAVDASRAAAYPSRFHGKRAFCSIEWTDDVRVFVSRIGTHRGRLPQGSPLSPLLANIAFAPLDSRIYDRLCERCGKATVRYTRYFDDITISVGSDGGLRAIRKPEAFRQLCQDVLAEELAGTRYRLNRKKTRVSSTEAGHDVTGLRVTKHSIALPRHYRRHLRATIHALSTKPFVDVAIEWYRGAALPRARFESILRGHRFEKSRLSHRKTSAERLATSMLRHVYPDLRLRRLLADWFPWQEREDVDIDRVEGKRLWPIMEWVLAALWTGAATVTRPEDTDGNAEKNRVVVRQGSVSVCELEAESSLGFFFLSKDAAVAVAEYWQHLRGVVSHLTSCPDQKAFEQIINYRTELLHALMQIEINRAEHEEREPPQVVETVFPTTREDYFRSIASGAVEYLKEFMRALQFPPGPIFGQATDAFSRQLARDWPSYEAWICAVAQATVDRCPRLPAGADRICRVDHGGLYQYLRVKNGVVSGDLSPDYGCVNQFEAELNIGPASPSGQIHESQIAITEMLRGLFGGACRERVHGTAWESNLFNNAWSGDLEVRLAELANDFERLHDLATSTAKERRLFHIESAHTRAEARKALLTKQEIGNSDHTWKILGQAGLTLYKTICEAIEESLCDSVAGADIKDVAAWKRSRVWNELRRLGGVGSDLRLVESLRHREAHEPTPARRRDWVDLQYKVRDVLGRTWKSTAGPKHARYFAADDLTLTRKEGLIVRVAMLRAANAWLAAVVERVPWRLNVGDE